MFEHKRYIIDHELGAILLRKSSVFLYGNNYIKIDESTDNELVIRIEEVISL